MVSPFRPIVLIVTKMSTVYIANLRDGSILSKINLAERIGSTFVVARHSENDNLLLLSKQGRLIELEYSD